jgi:hypothetical protein
VDDFVEYALRASRERMTPEELIELHRLGEQKATRDAWEAFFRRVVDRVEAGRRGRNAGYA